LEDDAWRELWHSLDLEVTTFREIGLAADASDAVIWQTCQNQELVLITGNRNKDGPDSLEATLRTQNTSESLPVFTIGSPDDVLHSKRYAHRVVERLLEYLFDIDQYRGIGRIYLP